MGRLRVTLGLLLWLGLPLAQASPDGLDQETATRLQQQGVILPLTQILQGVQARYPGRLLEIELERKKDRYVYEFELLMPSGEVLELKIDAASGEILQSEDED
jgi:uncharacterized membrane protein YkoI